MAYGDEGGVESLHERRNEEAEEKEDVVEDGAVELAAELDLELELEMLCDEALRYIEGESMILRFGGV